MSEVRHLKGFLVAISRKFGVPGQIPVICVANYAGERRNSTVCSILGSSTGEFVHSAETGEVELPNDGFGIGILGQCAAKLLVLISASEASRTVRRAVWSG